MNSVNISTACPLPNNWMWSRLDDLAWIDRDSLSAGTRLDFEFYYIDISTAFEGKLRFPPHKIAFRDAPSRARKVVRRGDVLMSTVRPNLKAFAHFDHSDDDCVASTGFAVLSAKDSADSKYLLYSLLSDDIAAQIDSHVVGSNYPAINSSDVRRLTVPTPPLGVQRKIARILTTLDELIEKTEALIAKYQAIKQGLMHDLFTRGVDEHGHLRPSYDEVPELYKETELGWIPKEWGSYSVGDRFANSAERGISGLPVMAITMNRGLVPRDSVDRRVESNLTAEGHLLVRQGDIAYNMMRMWQGVLGRADYDCLVSPAYIVLRPKDGIDTRFCAYLFSWEDSIAKFKRFSQGVVDDRLRLYFHDLVRIRFAIPQSTKEQEAIAERLTALDVTLDRLMRSVDKLQDQKRGQMQDLLTGKVKVMADEGEAAHA